MNRERWQEIEKVLAVLIELPEDQQEDYLERCCGDDPAMRSEVGELLAAHRNANAFIERPALHGFPGNWRDGLIGAVFGPYKLVERIGEGGMGAVYRAERSDGQFTQQVAVKLVQPGLRDAELLRRLRSERQILASLNHPNIARLLDGGITFDGQPFVVMEYIRGTRITTYCEQHSFTIQQRLELFQQVCSAASYAHQRLIVHRDIKPGNILVTEDGQPKLLDFGIAKILSAPGAGGEEKTLTQLNPLTPDYASPEQLRGEAITTATDIYSLGVLLYELLTVQKPYQLKDKTPQQAIEIVCQTDPERPSTAAKRVDEGRDSVSKAISPDLDAIVLKALRKEPEQRYASVEKLSEDVGNFLAARPVSAQQGSWRYVMGKFVRRHRAGVLMSAATGLLLMGGVLAVLWQAHVARAERARAEARFNDVRKLANSLIFEVHDGVANLPGSTPVRKLIMQRAAEYLDSLAKDATGDPGLQVELANAYIRLAEVQGSMNAANLGDLPGAEQTYVKAQSLLQSVLAREPLRDDANLLLARCDRALAYVYVSRSRRAEALKIAQTALALNQGLMARHANDDVYLGPLGDAWYVVADVHSGMDDPATPDDRAQALGIYEQLLLRHPDNLTLQRDLARAEKTTGSYLASHGSVQEASSHYQKAMVLDENRAKVDPQNAQAQLDLTFDLSEISTYYYRLADWDMALRYDQQALDIRQRLAEADPNNVQLRERIIFIQTQIANTLRRMGRLEEAGKTFQAAIEGEQSLIQAYPEHMQHRQFDLGFAYMGLGDIKRETAAHASAAQARSLRAQACDYYTKAAPLLNPGKNADPDRRKTVEQLEELMKKCPPGMAAKN